MLKLKLAKIEGLPPDIAKEYKAAEDGTFVLDTDVQFEDVTPLKTALMHEKKARKEATEKVTLLEGEVETLTSRAGNAGDIEKSWQKKLEQAEQKAKVKQDALSQQLRTVLVDNVAQTIAGEISTAPELIVPHIQKRLTIDEQDGKMITRVLDGDGKASALSVNELKSEIIADKRFAPIITGSKASGGGANGGQPPAGGKAFKEMNEAEKVALHRAVGPAKFKEMAAEAGVPVG